jgi:hypothetical protein
MTALATVRRRRLHGSGGRKHSEETKKRIAESNRREWAGRSVEERKASLINRVWKKCELACACPKHKPRVGLGKGVKHNVSEVGKFKMMIARKRRTKGQMLLPMF